MIATDLDGTFLNSSRQISLAHRRAFELCREAGVAFCLASGRAINTMLPFAESLGKQIPIVSANGAYVVSATGAPLLECYLPSGIPSLLLDYAESREVHVNVYQKDRIFSSHEGWEHKMYESRIGVGHIEAVGYSALREVMPTKILFIDHPPSIVIHQQNLHAAMARFEIPVVVSEPDYLEFLPNGVNKGKGLAALAAALGIEAGEVAAIGDWLNDLEMIEWAGLGGAVCNATEAVKEAADLVVASNDEDGVLQFVEHALQMTARV